MWRTMGTNFDFGARRTFVRIIVLLAWTSNFISHVCCGNSPMLDKLLEGYDKTIRPDHGVRPVEILADMYVESFGNIEEANMEFKVFGYFREQWTDMRLAGKSNHTISLKGGAIEDVWAPDPFCHNARETTMAVPDSESNSKLSISPHGTILKSKSVMFLASCDMDLLNFPMDIQECKLKFGSYAYTTNDIIYKWFSSEVQVARTRMAQFDYIGAKLSSETDVYSLTGNFSAIIVSYGFKRRIGYYIIQVYAPDIFIVMLSWIVFWMDKDDMGNRMALGITTILTIMFLLGATNGSMPKVSYAKALDWYLLISFVFVFLSLVECMIVFLISPKKKPARKKTDMDKHKMLPGAKRQGNGAIQNTASLALRERKEPNHVIAGVPANTESRDDFEDCEYEESDAERWNEISEKTDVVSRILFPLTFLVFNICYWIGYTL